MRKLALPVLGCAMLLAACGESGSAPAAPKQEQAKAKVENEHHKRLAALPDNLQRIGLMRQIRNTGNNCPFRVESGVYQQEYRTLAMWTARCDDNRQWAIFISTNGYVQVRNCADMEELSLPRCRELPPAPPQPQRKAARPRPKAGAD